MATNSPPTSSASKKKADAPALQKASSTANHQSAERALPHALGAEKSILSSMLQDPEQYIAEAIEHHLTQEHFYYPAHGTLFKILLEFYDKNEPIELVSFSQTLLDRGILPTIGGPSAITEIFTYSPTQAHFQHHIEIVKDKYILRSVIENCTEAIKRAYEDQEEVADLLDQVEQQVLAIRQGAEKQDSVSVETSVKEVIDHLEDFLSGKGELHGLHTGYADLDKICGGLKPGEIFIIAARPSMGKTSFAMNIIEHVSLNLNMPSMVFSMEMSAFQLVERLLYARARFPKAKLMKGYKPVRADLINIKKASEEIRNCKLFIDDTPGLSISELRAKARRKKKESDIQVIAVDYLQLMRSLSKQAQNAREREVAEISAGLKGLAKELNIPIIVIAQLNRGPESRVGSQGGGGKPRLSDLRESGSLEQDADLVGLLYRDSYYAEEKEEAEEEDGKAQLVIAKNRNGPTGDVPLTFIKEIMRFETRAWEREED